MLGWVCLAAFLMFPSKFSIYHWICFIVKYLKSFFFLSAHFSLCFTPSFRKAFNNFSVSLSHSIIIISEILIDKQAESFLSPRIDFSPLKELLAFEVNISRFKSIEREFSLFAWVEIKLFCWTIIMESRLSFLLACTTKHSFSRSYFRNSNNWNYDALIAVPLLLLFKLHFSPLLLNNNRINRINDHFRIPSRKLYENFLLFLLSLEDILC